MIPFTLLLLIHIEEQGLRFPTADSVASAAVPHLPCTDVSDPRNVPLPVDSELGPDDMDTTSTRKRSRPQRVGQRRRGASRKLQAVAAEHLTVTTPTTPSSDAVADEHSATHDADATNETDFQLVLSKSQKRRQRTTTSPRPDTSVDTPPGTTTAAHPSFTRYVPACATQLSATQPAVVGAIAASDTIRPSASSPPACGTVLFRPANIGASFHRTSRLAIAQALYALPGVKEVRVNTKKNIVAADASTAEWMDRLLATSELAGIPVTARPPADRSQSSGVVQGVDGDFTDEALLAAVTSEVPVIAATRQGTSLVLRFASPIPPAPVAESGAWPPSRRQLPPTCLIARLRQPCGQALAGRVVLHSNQAKGKSYAAAVGSSIQGGRDLDPSAPARRRAAEAAFWSKKQGSVKPRPPAKATPESHLNQENTNLRLLLRAVADLLPPENQLRSICLQAGGVPPS
ncbi:hypothetical protein MTO96_034524 [Rhipicephalus appendiculatus]